MVRRASSASENRHEPPTPSPRSSSSRQRHHELRSPSSRIDREKLHKPRSHSSRTSSRSPGGQKSPSGEHTGTPGKRHSSSGKPHGHRRRSPSPHRKQNLKRSSSRRRMVEPVKQSISKEDLEHFLFSSGQMPTSPNGTMVQPRIIVRKQSSGIISRQHSENRADFGVSSCSGNLISAATSEDQRSTISRTKSEGPDVRRLRKANVTEVKGAGFVVPDTSNTAIKPSPDTLKKLQRSVSGLSSPAPLEQKAPASPMKRMLGGLKNIALNRDAVPVKKMPTPQRSTEPQAVTVANRTRRASLVAGLVGEHKDRDKNDKSASPVKKSRRMSNIV